MLSNVVLRLIDDALENHLPTVSDEFARHEGLIFQRGLMSLLAMIAETAALGGVPIDSDGSNFGSRIRDRIANDRWRQVADAGLTGLRSLHHNTLSAAS